MEKKRLRKEGQSIWELWNNYRWTNICAIGVPEQQGRWVGRRRYRKVMIEIFPNFVRAINPRNSIDPEPNKRGKKQNYTQGHS